MAKKNKRLPSFIPASKQQNKAKKKKVVEEPDRTSVYEEHLRAKIHSFYQTLDKADKDLTFDDLELLARRLVLFEEVSVKDYALRLVRWCATYPERLNFDLAACRDFIQVLQFHFCDHDGPYEPFKAIYTKEEAWEIANWIYTVVIALSEDGYVALKDTESKRIMRGLDFWANFGEFIP